MKPALSVLLFATLLFSCQQEPPKQEVKVEEIPAEIPKEDTFPYDTLQGMYMADFGGSPIRIVLNYVSSTNAIGYNLHKGLQRNITGSVTRAGDSIQLILSEPGDNEFDGVFTLDFIGMNDGSPKGKWVANKEGLPNQNFKMKKLESKKSDSNEEVTVMNFARIFSEMSDTLGEYQFNDDGFVLLKYYPDKDVAWDQQQYEEIKGSWDLQGDKVIINWEPNSIFKGNTLTLEIKKYEYGEYSLKGEGKHELWMMWF